MCVVSVCVCYVRWHCFSAPTRCQRPSVCISHRSPWRQAFKEQIPSVGECAQRCSLLLTIVEKIRKKFDGLWLLGKIAAPATLVANTLRIGYSRSQLVNCFILFVFVFVFLCKRHMVGCLVAIQTYTLHWILVGHQFPTYSPLLLHINKDFLFTQTDNHSYLAWDPSYFVHVDARPDYEQWAAIIKFCVILKTRRLNVQ